MAIPLWPVKLIISQLISHKLDQTSPALGGFPSDVLWALGFMAYDECFVCLFSFPSFISQFKLNSSYICIRLYSILNHVCLKCWAVETMTKAFLRFLKMHSKQWVKWNTERRICNPCVDSKAATSVASKIMVLGKIIVVFQLRNSLITFFIW